MTSPGALVKPRAARVTRWCAAGLITGLSVAVVCATTASGAVASSASRPRVGGLVDVHSTAAAPPTAAASPGAATATTRRTWLEEINYYRRGAGLQTVSNRRWWDRGILNHLRYLELTPAKYFKGQYQSFHTENPASPYYTMSGALEGSRSDLLIGSAGGARADIDQWLTAPFHAIGMLRYGLRRVAFAAGYIGAGLDVLGGLTGAGPDPKPILFPGNRVTTNLTSYAGDELPDPLQSCRRSFRRRPVGLPIIALLPASPSRRLSASLRWPHGKVQRTRAGSLCLVDQFTYRSTDKIYGPTGLAILEGDNAVLLFPLGTLANGGYTVTIADTSKIHYQWRFKVAK